MKEKLIHSSGDGDNVEIESRFINNSSSAVQLFSYDVQSSEWGQLGNTLSSDAILSHDAVCISLSFYQSGQCVVIGNANSSASGPGTSQVEIYKYSKLANSWKADDSPPMYGDDMHGTGESTSLCDHNGALSLAVTSPCSVVNYAGSGSVCECNDLHSNWRSLGDYIIGDQSNSHDTVSLSLSTDPYANSLMVAMGSKHHRQEQYSNSNNSETSTQDQFRSYEYSKMKMKKKIHNQKSALSINRHCVVVPSPFHSTEECNNTGHVNMQCYNEKQQWIHLEM